MPHDLELAELLPRAASGDQGAWDALVARFSSLVWSVARAHRLGSADAADVSQTTWLRLVEHLDRIRDPERVGAWLAATARNECLRVIRRADRQVPFGAEVDVDIAEDAPPLDSRMLTEERDRALARAFEQISARCRSLLRLLMADPAPSYQEVAAATGWPIGSLGPTRARCLERLREKAGLVGIAGEDLAT